MTSCKSYWGFSEIVQRAREDCLRRADQIARLKTYTSVPWYVMDSVKAERERELYYYRRMIERMKMHSNCDGVVRSYDPDDYYMNERG